MGNGTKHNSWQRVFATIGRIAIGATLVYTAYGKLKPPFPGFGWSIATLRVSLAMFAISIEAYKILPAWATTLTADILPFFELTLGIWLITGIAARFSTLCSTVLFATFFSAMLSVYLRGIKAGCGCGLIPDEQIGPLSLTIDAAFLLVCALITTVEFRLRKPGPSPTFN
jgi:hypothetical protein